MILSDKIQQFYRKSGKNRKNRDFQKVTIRPKSAGKCFSAGNTSNEVSKTSLNHYTHIWHHFTSLWFQVKKKFFSSQKMSIFKKGDFWLIVLFANLWCYILTLMWVYTYLLGFFYPTNPWSYLTSFLGIHGHFGTSGHFRNPLFSRLFQIIT